MKKFMVVLFVLLMIVSLTSCSSGNVVTKEPKNVVTKDDNSKETNSDSEHSITEDKNTEDSSKDSDVITIDEQVLFDSNDIIITAKELVMDESIFGPSIKVLVENNSNKDITAQINNLSVNGVMAGCIFSCDVVSGKKANDTITIESSYLEEANITRIKDIEFSFHIFDYNEWETIVESDIIKIKTSVDDSYVQEYDDSGFIALDNNGVKIIVKKMDSQSSFWGSDIYIYAENNTDKNITIQANDVSINGFMIDPIFSCDLMSGKKAYDKITFMESDLTDNGIESIEFIELIFHIFDMDEWDTIYDSDAITINFE